MFGALAVAAGVGFALATYVVIGNLCPDWMPDWLCFSVI